MFIGHYGVAFAAKRVDSRVSLGTYVLAAQLLDLLWPILLIAGVEHVRIAPGVTAVTPLDFYDYPYSHSLAMTIVWAGVAAGAHFLFKRELRSAFVIGACVASHWLLDYFTHRPDMPIGLTGPYVGLGLWYSKLGTALVEGGMLSLGIALYWRARHARKKIGNELLVVYVAVLLAIYIPQFLAPPPPSDMAIAWIDLGQLLLVAWRVLARSLAVVDGDARARADRSIAGGSRVGDALMDRLHAG
jgi:hypothetical protein